MTFLPPRGVPSLEDREQMRMKVLQQSEADRKERVLDPNIRIKGLDTITLSRQVEESKARKLQQKLSDDKMERQILHASHEAARQEALQLQKKKQGQAQYRQDLLEMMKEKKERDISESAYIGRPASGGTGAASMQFKDDEILRSSRRYQQADFVSQSLYDKGLSTSSAALAEHRAAGGCYVPRDPFDETARRRQLAQELQSENQRISREKVIRNIELKRRDDAEGLAEAEYLATRSSLNEDLVRNIPVRAENQEVASQFMREKFAGCDNKVRNQEEFRIESDISEHSKGKNVEDSRRGLVFSDDSKIQERRQQAVLIGQENARLAQEQKERERLSKKQANDFVSSDFFGKFSQTSR